MEGKICFCIDHRWADEHPESELILPSKLLIKSIFSVSGCA